jgi:hypothetical protein
MQAPLSAIKRIIPFYAPPNRVDLYRDFDVKLIKQSRVMCCYCTRKGSVEYCSVHIIIPARVPDVLLDIMNEDEAAVYSILSGPYSGLCYFESDFTSEHKLELQAKIQRIPDEVKTWEMVHEYTKLTPGLRVLTKQSLGVFHTNRTNKYIRMGQGELRKIINGEASILDDDPDIQEAIEALNIHWIAAEQFIHDQYSDNTSLSNHIRNIDMSRSDCIDKIQQEQSLEDD